MTAFYRLYARRVGHATGAINTVPSEVNTRWHMLQSTGISVRDALEEAKALFPLADNVLCGNTCIYSEEIQVAVRGPTGDLYPVWKDWHPAILQMVEWIRTCPRPYVAGGLLSLLLPECDGGNGMLYMPGHIPFTV